MKVNRTASWVAVGLCVGLVPLGVAVNISRAQDMPAKGAETLEQKVARLEKEVGELRKQVGELERRSPVFRIQPTPPGIGGVRPSLSPDAKPFTFNDRTYYFVPLNDDKKPAVAVALTQEVEPRVSVPAVP